MAHNIGLDTLIAYIGMFHQPDQECGCSLILHGWKTYLPMLGPSNWDGKSFAFIQDVADDEIVSMEVAVVHFSHT